MKVDSGESSTGQIAHTSISPSQITVKKPSVIQVTRLDVGIPEITVAKFSAQTAMNQIDATQINIDKSSIPQIDALQFSPTQIIVLYQDVPEVSTSSSIPHKQVFNSNLFHTLTPESITSIDNTAQTLWNNLLAPQTPFNINLYLSSSLAEGQLVEAVVTKYDAHGRPIGGIIEWSGERGSFATEFDIHSLGAIAQSALRPKGYRTNVTKSLE